MYSLEELTNSVMNGLDELFNINKLRSHVECVSKDEYDEEKSMITFIPSVNSNIKIRVKFIKSEDDIVTTILIDYETHTFVDFNVLDLQEMTTLIMLNIKSSYISFCRVRGI